jgi:serine/threonine protein phosphatase PrpC
VTDTRTATRDVIHAAARTHPGRVRLNNEDLPVIDTARGIFGVIDGIGGQAGGEVAAATAKDVILQRLARPVGTPAERVREAIAIANNEIHRRATQSSELHGMACVITLAVVSDGHLTIGHVGDSRLYKIRPSGLRKLTHDHSPVGEREDAGELSEVDAMRHPRRHEVFRDVGSVLRDKDEHEFVDVIEELLEPDSAILLCSDGLTDMLPASTVAHIITQHAGNPERVVETLVAAANDAGGRDNVTVVYAEMPGFPHAINGGPFEDLAPTEPLAERQQGTAGADGVAGASGGGIRQIARFVVGSRITWFALGLLAGVVGALMLTLYVARSQVRASQTLVVAIDGSAPFTTITAAIDEARPGDVVRVEPGVYEERIQVSDGIHLLARVPLTVTIRRPPGADAAAPVMMLTGSLNVRVSGIRVEAHADSPSEVGIRVSCPDATLDLMEVAGAIRQAIGLSQGSSITMRGSRVTAGGALIVLPDEGHATFINNVFARAGAPAAAPIDAHPSAHLVLRGNVFSSYGVEIIKGLADARRRELLEGNVIVTPVSVPGRPTDRRR